MSHSLGRNGVASGDMYHDSVAADDSGTGAPSLSSQLEMYDSELAPTSQSLAESNVSGTPHGHTQIYYGEEEQLHRYEMDDGPLGLQVQSMPRSTPIAIKRTPGDGNQDAGESETDEEEDNDSEIDVEGDAIKLQRKYGTKVIQTYNQESTIIRSSKDRASLSFLNAPYLGSLSKSSNQVLSLPPMSLAGAERYVGEPPETVVSYGSLRDSHERGRFLDGPSSYREPTSGRIHHLDHRLRYHGRQQGLNIGERLQQSRKLKELRQKEENKKDRMRKDGGDSAKDKKPTTSSLSAMMRDAPEEIKDNQVGLSAMETEGLVPIQAPTSFAQGFEHTVSRNSSPKIMLSTSLTAFELLTTSNKRTLSPPQHMDQQTSTTNTSDTAFQKNGFGKQSGFQVLSRSMSDPCPRFQNLSLSEGLSGSRIFPGLMSEGVTSQTGHAIPDRNLRNVANGHTLQQFEPQVPAKYGMPDSGNANHFTFNTESTSIASSPVTSQQTNLYDGRGLRSPNQDHDPNTDGAFGDMDM